MNEPQTAPEAPVDPAPTTAPNAAAPPTVVNERREPCGCVFIDWSNGGKNVEPCLAHGLGAMHDAMKNVIAALDEFNRMIDVTAQIELRRLKGRPALSVVRGAAAEHVLGRRS